MADPNQLVEKGKIKAGALVSTARRIPEDCRPLLSNSPLITRFHVVVITWLCSGDTHTHTHSFKCDPAWPGNDRPPHCLHLQLRQTPPSARSKHAFSILSKIIIYFFNHPTPISLTEQNRFSLFFFPINLFMTPIMCFNRLRRNAPIKRHQYAHLSQINITSHLIPPKCKHFICVKSRLINKSSRLGVLFCKSVCIYKY